MRVLPGAHVPRPFDPHLIHDRHGEYIHSHAACTPSRLPRRGLIDRPSVAGPHHAPVTPLDITFGD